LIFRWGPLLLLLLLWWSPPLPSWPSRAGKSKNGPEPVISSEGLMTNAIAEAACQAWANCWNPTLEQCTWHGSGHCRWLQAVCRALQLLRAPFGLEHNTTALSPDVET
jgi:hypothetical protein